MAKSPSKITAELADQEEASSVQSLRKLPIFRGVPAEAVTLLLDASAERFFLKGEYIFKQNDPASSLVILNNGMAVEFKRLNEVDCLLSYFTDTAVLGESSFLESSPRSTSLFANEDCWVTEIDNEIFKKMDFANAGLFETLYLNLGRELGRKVLSIHEKLHQACQLRLIRERTVHWSLY